MGAARSAWNEAAHPRAHGKFASKGGGGGKKAPAKGPAQFPGGDWRKREPAGGWPGGDWRSAAASESARKVHGTSKVAREAPAPGSWPGASPGAWPGGDWRAPAPKKSKKRSAASTMSR